MHRIDDQAVLSRFGSAEWLSSFITPDNPDVRLLYDKLAAGVSQDDAIVRCWQYVANIPYVKTVRSRLTIGGKSYEQPDTWLYPAETINLSPVGNCATKSFLLASLLRNALPASQVHCVMGHVWLDGIGAHAWVETTHYLLETTQPELEKALVPKHRADTYESVIKFNDTTLEAMSEQVEALLRERFGFCAHPFLADYLCRRCEEITR